MGVGVGWKRREVAAKNPNKIRHVLYVFVVKDFSVGLIFPMSKCLIEFWCCSRSVNVCKSVVLGGNTNDSRSRTSDLNLSSTRLFSRNFQFRYEDLKKSSV